MLTNKYRKIWNETNSRHKMNSTLTHITATHVDFVSVLLFNSFNGKSGI